MKLTKAYYDREFMDGRIAINPEYVMMVRGSGDDEEFAEETTVKLIDGTEITFIDDMEHIIELLEEVDA